MGTVVGEMDEESDPREAAAVKAFCGERPIESFGFESGIAKVENTKVTLWFEECYATWSIEYIVDAEGVAEEVPGSRTPDDGTETPPDISFDTEIPGVDMAFCEAVNSAAARGRPETRAGDRT